MKQAATFFFLAIFISTFAQSGITWNSTMDIANNTHDNMHPRIATDGAGNPLVIWGRMSDASVLFSRWNGTMFTSPVKLNGSLTVAGASWMGSSIAAKGDTVYVVMKRTPEDKDTNRIFIVCSFDGGQNFSQPAELGFIADSISRFPTVAIDENGNPIVAFMKFDATFMDSRWVVTRSNDFGSTFLPDVKASGWGGSTEVCDCCPGALISSGNTTAMLYRNNNANIRDTWVGISTNNAAFFNTGFNADNRNWMIMSCPSTGPDGVIIKDTLYSVFASAGSGSYRTYLSKSTLGTNTIDTVQNLTGTITGLTQQNYPRIASSGKALGIVWKQNVSGSAQLPILFTNNVANGLPSAYDTVKLGNITNADIAITKGSVYVVWQDDQSGTVKFRSGSFLPDTMVATGINFIPKKKIDMKLFPNPAINVVNIEVTINDFFAYAIINSIGEKVIEGSATHRAQIDTQNLLSGIYYVQVLAGSQSYTDSFTKK